MHFYRSFGSIKAICFDLDDTLYNNQPVLDKTEQKTLAFLQQQHPIFKEMDIADLKRLRQDLLITHPEIYHDVSQWRHDSVSLFLLAQGESKQRATLIADGMMECFDHWRSQITVPEETHKTLRYLAQRYPLAVITNGNAVPEKFGIGHYFQFVLKSGADGRSKPYSDMFTTASQWLGIPPQHILHVGDDLITDVSGAILNGFIACWINVSQYDIFRQNESRLLPHVEISQLALLQQLL